MAEVQDAIDFWFWPLRLSLGISGHPPQPAAEIAWRTPNEIMADMATMRLRRFASSHKRRAPMLIVAPFAVHDSGIADLASGHSLIEALDACGRGPIALTEWKSAESAMAGASIDSYLADLNVAVDLVSAAANGHPPDIVGLCQGGWMALLYAAAFPRKLRRLVVVGAPVDTSHRSSIAQSTQYISAPMLDRIIAASGGLVSGEATLALFRATGAAETDVCDILQIAPPAPPDLLARYQAWDARAVTLPGRYYTQVANWLFRENRLAQGYFPAFGRPTPLSRVKAPLFILSGARDNIAPTAQAVAAADLVGTAPENIVCVQADCSHLALFLGARTLAGEWRKIGTWLGEA